LPNGSPSSGRSITSCASAAGRGSPPTHRPRHIPTGETMTAKREIHAIAILAGSPGNPLLKRAIAAYRKASSNPLATRKPIEPAGDSAAVIFDDEVYVVLDLPGGRLWVYKLAGTRNQLRLQERWPAEIDEHFAPAS
jgi:hypothetical protein